MAFKRSGVRLPLSPPKKKASQKNDLLFFFCDDYGEHLPLLQSKRGAQVALATWRK